MFGTLGPTELLVLFGIIALLFGGKRLPEMGKGIGQGIRNLRFAIQGKVEGDEEED